VMSRLMRSDPTQRHSSDDPHLDVLLFILRGLPQPERAAWLARRMPKTAALLSLRAHWEGLADPDTPHVRV